MALPAGLVESDRLPEPIFTPTTKAAAGHDLPLTPDETRDLVGDGPRRAAEGADAHDLRTRRGGRARARDHPRRHEVRVRVRGRRAAPDRRGVHAGLVAVLAGRRVPAGRAAAVVRQAVRARLAGFDRLGPRAAGPGAAGRRGRADRIATYREAYERLTGEAVRRLPARDGSDGVTFVFEVLVTLKHGLVRPAGQGGRRFAARARLDERARTSMSASTSG